MSADDIEFDDTDLGPDELPPVHLLVSAADRPLPETWGWPSIFDFAAAGGPGANGLTWGSKARSEANPPTIQERMHISIVRTVGLVRCRRIHYLDTDAWQEKEAERRARQVLPKPPKQRFRLRGTAAA